MRTALAALTLLAFAVAPVAAQDVTSGRRFGDWHLTCRVDGMTDRTSCALLNGSFDPGAGAPVVLRWEDEGPRISLMAGPQRFAPAWLRIGRNAPAAVGPCADPMRGCVVGDTDAKRIPAEIAAGAETALLRIGKIDDGVDRVFNLAGFAEARAELRRYLAAIPRPTVTAADEARQQRAALLAAYRAAEQRCETLPRAQILACKSAWADCVKTDPATEAALENCLARTRHDAKGIAARTAAR